MNAWSHLPNAPLIDWVLQSLKTDPKKWVAALSATLDAERDAAWVAARDAAINAAWYAARSAARAAARAAAWRAARDAALDATWNAARSTNWIIARDVILALIAYDDCRQYLHMSYEQLLAWAHLSERPQAVLLLPLKWIQEHECLVTTP